MTNAPTHCPFCDLIHGAAEVSVCYEDEKAIAFLDGNTANISRPVTVKDLAVSLANGVDDKGPFTAWYAPGVGLVKLAHRGRTIQELKEFRPAG